MTRTLPGDVISLDAFRTGQAYTAAQAARLAGTTPATVRRWLQGSEAPGHQMSPVFGSRGAAVGQLTRVSFLELVEIIVAAQFRRGGDGHSPVALQKIRCAHDYARQHRGVAYPFASLQLVEHGGHLLHE